MRQEYPQLGLTVRWSLADAPVDTLDRLREYVRDSSHERFEGMPGLAFKTWRARAGEWFEGCYVFADSAERESFQDNFPEDPATWPGSVIIGAPPILVEPWEALAVAEGGAGFTSRAGY